MVSIAQHITFVNQAFICNMEESQLDVFTRLCILNWLLLRIVDSLNLAWESTRNNGELLSQINCSLLNFSKDYNTSIFHLIKNRNSNWSIGISGWQLQIVEDVKIRLTLVPIADFLVNHINQIVA
jgi:hypothetical protein